MFIAVSSQSLSLRHYNGDIPYETRLSSCEVTCRKHCQNKGIHDRCLRCYKKYCY